MAPLLWTDLSCQSIKLVGHRHAVAAFDHELAFANHVHEFDASQDGLRRPERFKPKHRPGDALDGTMILLDDIVEILDLPDLDRDVSLRIQLVERSLVGAALVHRHRTGDFTVPHRFVEKAPCRCRIAFGSQQEIDSFALLVHRAIEIFPDTFDLDVGFIHAPAFTNGMLMISKRLFQQGQEPDRPAID